MLPIHSAERTRREAHSRVPCVISPRRKESSCRCFERVELFRAGMASLTKSELDRKTSLRSRSLAHESRSTRIALRSGCPCLPRRQATNMLILTRDHLTCKSHCTHTASQHRLYSTVATVELSNTSPPPTPPTVPYLTPLAWRLGHSLTRRTSYCPLPLPF